MLSRKNSLVLIFVLSIFQFAFSTSSNNSFFYPRINFLDSRKDEIFKQYEMDVQLAKKQFASNENPSFMLYQYKTTEDDNLFTISARCNILQETIATLNHISSPTEDISNREILLPTVDGIFVSNSPVTPFESILKKKLLSIR